MGNQSFLRYFIPFLFLFFISFVLIASILNKSRYDEIEEGDIVTKCVIDTFYVTESSSTIEFGKRYHYSTDCDEFVITKRNDVYKIGDTITFIYKKR
jgi:hypothetical protein